MNERIRELAFQASENYDYHPEFAKKFAELIVKEMVDECAKVCVQHTGWTPDMIAKQVKQHFGVEE